jgi:hypothetical protein
MAPKNRTLRTDIPADVWQRFADEAHAKGSNPGRYLRELLVARDTKKHGASPSTPVTPSGVSRNQQEEA